MVRAIPALLALFVLGWGQLGSSSCVQVVNNTAAGNVSPFTDEEPSLTFTMEGVTNFTTSNVNLVLVVDGSGSVASDDWTRAQQFAKDTVAAFSRRSLFDNGGTASYVQFSAGPLDMGTFYSEEDFNAHVDLLAQYNGSTDLVNGIQAGAELMYAHPASFGIMVLVTDGDHTSDYGGDPVQTAAKIRADNTTSIFAVGVGDEFELETLIGIAGRTDKVFDIDDFNELEAVLPEIEVGAEKVLSCPATGVRLTIEFDVPVSSVAKPDDAIFTTSGGTITGDNRVTFTVAELENNPTQFAVGLKECGEVISVEYDDEQGNSPDFSTLPDPTCFEYGRTAATVASTIAIGTAILIALTNVLEAAPIAIIGVGQPSPPGVVNAPRSGMDQESSRGATEEDKEAYKAGKRPGSQGESKSTVDDDTFRGDSPPDAAFTGTQKTLEKEGEREAQGGAPRSTDGEGGQSGMPDAAVVAGHGALVAAQGGSARSRSPSSTLARLMVVQVQFLAVLSLVDSINSRSWWFSNILEDMRWYNLWIPIWEDPEDPDRDSNNVDEEDFLGNVVIVAFVGLLILVLHVLVVSAVEVNWLQATKRNNLAEARTDFGEEDQLPVGNGEKAATGGSSEEPAEQIATYRERSQSIWIYFPHVELVFLLYAVQGSLTAQLAVLREGGGAVFYAAAVALVVYPVFIAGMMFRVIFVRVLPNAGGVTFTPTKTDNRGCQNFFSRVLKGLKEEHSMLAWATKGVWRTADNVNGTERKLVDWFRVGFEPLFADFTQSGSWFAVYSLLESYATACIGVFLDSNSQWQLVALMVLNLVAFVLVLCRKPFANRAVNVIAACRLGLNAMCMALLAFAHTAIGNPYEEAMGNAVGIAALLFLVLGLAAPVLVEGLVVLAKVMHRSVKACCCCRGDRSEQAKEARGDGCCALLLRWVATWFTTIGRNFAAYRKDLANGLLQKPHSQ